MLLRKFAIIALCAAQASHATAQEASTVAQTSASKAPRELLAKGMAMLDGIWSGNETGRKAVDNAMTETSAGTFESRMNRETYTATVTNEGQVFHIRLEDGALIYSAPGRDGEQRREIQESYPVDENGTWYIAVTYLTPFTNGTTYEVTETYRMDDGVYTRMAEGRPADGKGPPMFYRWGSFTKTGE